MGLHQYWDFSFFLFTVGVESAFAIEIAARTGLDDGVVKQPPDEGG